MKFRGLLKIYFRHKTKEFWLESMITRLWIEKESCKQDQKDEALVVSNINKEFIGSFIKPTGKSIKNNNLNLKNCNKNENPSKTTIVKLKLPFRNDSGS